MFFIEKRDLAILKGQQENKDSYVMEKLFQ